MKVARVILELGSTQSEISGPNPWQSHKLSIERDFRKSPTAYVDRIERVCAAAASQGCDLVLLPACTLFHRTQRELQRYCSSAKSFPWIVSGALRHYPGSNGFDEIALVVKKGKVVCSLDSSVVEQRNIDQIPALLAISSTVSQIRNLQELPFKARKNSRCLVLDMGHHQYRGRYMMTLRSVASRLSRKFMVQPHVLLAFWRYKNSKINSPWAVSARSESYRRIEQPWGDHTDFIDVFST